MTLLSTCTSLSCLTDCWVCVFLAVVVGGFVGLLVMAMCVAARDADERAARWDGGSAARLEADERARRAAAAAAAAKGADEGDHDGRNGKGEP